MILLKKNLQWQEPELEMSGRGILAEHDVGTQQKTVIDLQFDGRLFAALLALITY